MTTSRNWQAGQGQPPNLTDGETEACKATAVSQSQSCLQGLAHRAQRMLANSFKGAFYMDRAHRGLCGSKAKQEHLKHNLRCPPLHQGPFPHRPPQNPCHQGGLLSSLGHILETQDTSSRWHLLVQRPLDLIRPHRSQAMFLGKGNSLDLTAPRTMQATRDFTRDSPNQPAALGQLCI